jgi:hypothetical protein
MKWKEDFNKWYEAEKEEAKRCCDNCYYHFINSELNIERAYEAGYKNVITDATIILADPLEEISKDIYRDENTGIYKGLTGSAQTATDALINWNLYLER